MKRVPIPFWVVLISVMFRCVQVFGQVTYETSTTSNGFYGLGAFVSEAKILIQGDARRQESVTKFTGAIMKLFNPKGTQFEITRLDKQLSWNFNDQEKSYTETTFAELRKLIEDGKLYQPIPGQEGSNKDQSEYEWGQPIVAVKNLGDRQKINNFNCDHYLVTVSTIGKHKTTGKLDTLLLSADLFNSINVGKAMTQISDFDKRYIETLGMNKVDNMVIAQVLNSYGAQWSELQKEMSKVQGYPIRNTLSLTVTSHATESETIAKKEESSPPPTDLRQTFGGLLGKKAQQAVTPKNQNDQQNKKEIFQSTHELKTIAVGDIASELFKVPDGYKLKARK